MFLGRTQPTYTAPQQKESQSRQQNNVLHANHLIGHSIRVNRGGHDSVEGILLAIPGDYLVLSSDNAICYVNGAHVKSITEGSKNGSGGSRSSGSGGSRSRRVHRSFITAPNFNSLLSHFKHKHVQINRGGPEKLDGFLAETSADNVLLIVDRELVRIPTFHIKNVCASTKNQNNKNNNKNNKSGSSKNNKSGGKSRSSKSGGNRSGGKNRSGGGQGRSRSGGRR
ncbi:hypothetical protein ACF3MZ_03700 [Paenibacillaceae bacterium WGS1546]|uniref:hypothetical protein n=1 Tax=Cohnella sp. WGS1546 TaxID=3366810 RepID=UPI00372D7904